MQKKPKILFAFAIFVLIVGWTITPAQADCPHKENENHRHCANRVLGGVLITFAGDISNSQLLYNPTSQANSNNITDAQILIPKDTELLSLAVNIPLNTLDADATITVILNGGDTSLQVIIPAGTTPKAIVESVVNVVANDLVVLEVDATAAGSGTMRFLAIVEHK